MVVELSLISFLTKPKFQRFPKLDSIPKQYFAVVIFSHKGELKIVQKLQKCSVLIQIAIKIALNLIDKIQVGYPFPIRKVVAYGLRSGVGRFLLRRNSYARRDGSE